jgi:hypothetical protein
MIEGAQHKKTRRFDCEKAYAKIENRHEIKGIRNITDVKI